MKKQARPATKPMISADMGVTKPAAGVMPTSPATAPQIAPRTDGLLCRNHALNIQPRVAAAAAKCVATKALEERELAWSALPALKPNHPTQSMHAPITLRTKLWGGAIGFLSNPTRFPR